MMKEKLHFTILDRMLVRKLLNAVLVASVFLLAEIAFCNTAYAESEVDEFRELIEEAIESVDLSEWEEYLDSSELSKHYSEMGFGAAELIEELALANASSEPEGIFDRVIAAVIPQLYGNAPLILAVFAVAVLSGIAGMLFKGDGMDAPVKLALSSAAALSAAAAFSTLASSARDAVVIVGGFCEICAPPLSLLLSACGCAETGAAVLPKLSMLGALMARLLSGAVLPSLLIGGILCILGGVSEKLRFANAVKLIHKSVKWAMGLASVIYGSTVIIGGTCAAAMDGALFRSTKYTVDKLLPFGGSVVTGTVETVASSVMLVKNAVGIAGIVFTALLLFSPLVKLAGGIFAFRIAAALSEPFAQDSRLAQMLGGLADTLGCMFAVCACSGAMLTLMLGVLVSAGSNFF